jgi:phenylalanyl-tRNA synthetase alpha chain
MKDEAGHLHPITGITEELVKLFEKEGFSVATGPEMEDEWHNFDALNVPKDHPARDMQDTFWLDNKKLLRTHTSSVQIRYMMENKENLPLAIISPGKVFRNENTDRTHEAQFHQIEGLVVGENISVANLKYYLEKMVKSLFGDDFEIRLRPSYFPFVEPGFEVDIRKSGEKWLEILGAGMVHPNVLNSVGIDPNKYSGFAFGVGLDRLVMMKNGVNDVRDLYTGDLRIVNQF